MQSFLKLAEKAISRVVVNIINGGDHSVYFIHIIVKHLSGHVFIELWKGMEMKRGKGSNSRGKVFNSSEWCNQIPYEIIERIYARLPIKSILQAQTVCKGWNSLFSSTHFWAQHSTLNASHIWLLFCMVNTSHSNVAYCFSTQKWNHIPPTLMTSKSSTRRFSSPYYCGSSEGILLMGVGMYAQTLFVCNPLTRQFIQLPPTLSIELNELTAKGIVICKDRMSYKVVAIGNDKKKSNAMSLIEIYSSCRGSWRIAAKIPSKFTQTNEIVLCNDSFFCLVRGPESKKCLLYSNIQDDYMYSVVLSLPDLLFRESAKLVACGSSILLTARKWFSGAVIFIWKFDCNNSRMEYSRHPNSTFGWKKVATMPLSLCNYGEYPWYECEGYGDYLCFRWKWSLDVVTYNVREGTWAMLPPCPTSSGKNVQTIKSFRPGLDIKP